MRCLSWCEPACHAPWRRHGSQRPPSYADPTWLNRLTALRYMIREVMRLEAIKHFELVNRRIQRLRDSCKHMLAPGPHRPVCRSAYQATVASLIDTRRIDPVKTWIPGLISVGALLEINVLKWVAGDFATVSCSIDQGIEFIFG